MSDEALEERLAAVERALDEGDPTPSGAPADLADRVEALEADVAELEAAVQAVRGYVGEVKHVNDEVEQRADAAMAKAQAIERALAADRTPDGNGHQPRPCPHCGGTGQTGDHDEASSAGTPPTGSGRDGPHAEREEQRPGDVPGSSTPGRRPGEVGHRTLDAAEPENRGLVARLREVL